MLLHVESSAWLSQHVSHYRYYCLWVTGQVIQADDHTVCLRLRTSVTATPPDPAMSTSGDAEGEPPAEPQEPFVDPFMDTQHERLPWPWMRSPPGSDRGGPPFSKERALNACSGRRCLHAMHQHSACTPAFSVPPERLIFDNA